MKVDPYLIFNGRCEEAIQFYVDALGARLEVLMHFSDAPPEAQGGCAQTPEGVMHASFRIGDSVVMATDGAPGEPKPFGSFALTLTVVDELEAVRCFDALTDGGQVTMPLAPTFFAHQFGMVTDRFGVAWNVIFPKAM
ncbi:VOC family protein [Nitrogeniibacter mangrovi]|uniref:VOC family protein n=1 Tax=Nitrogeniibacter mangrovi TaxID=2016596 RepID=A0A6C1B6W2_9RHOO|nr:VOC family protein [Nitrogeniibacter mangrovi]QID19207.1 VOC family protein [Nitrogeniibacter mangrovi]